MKQRDWRHGEITGAIIKSFYAVYDALGYGFLESVYRKGLRYELEDNGLEVQAEVPIDVWLKRRSIGHFRADLIVNRAIVVEVKATRYLVEEDNEQVQNYLRATNMEVGLLLHFGPKPTFRRFEIENLKKPGVPPQ